MNDWGAANFILGGGLTTLIIGLATILKTRGRLHERLGNLEKHSHSAPCKEVSIIHESLGRIETNITWLMKNGRK